MINPGFASNIFKCIRQEAGQNALKLATLIHQQNKDVIRAGLTSNLSNL